ncbi:hypothetical protein [Petrimonas sp.]|jgi:hypothetical protein|uniref:hypothetical protein n=1 Tax=Petrimonas sp. TaxID=2023866 RepID=UPI001BD45788
MNNTLNYRRIYFSSSIVSSGLYAQPGKVPCAGNSVIIGLGIENPAEKHPNHMTWDEDIQWRINRLEHFPDEYFNSKHQ